MDNNPLISVIMSLYNEEKNIKKLFNSISKLKNKLSLETIIINNGSTDNSRKVIKLNKKCMGSTSRQIRFPRSTYR